MYRSTVTGARDGFAQVLRAEWTKFRSVRSTAWCVLAAIALTLLLTLLLSSAGSTNANEGPRYTDSFTFVHQPLTGDGTITARVPTQRNSQEWAKAGVIVKASTADGAPYAAIMVTPEHGVRLQANFTTDIAGTGGGAPRWLRLTRSGTTITGYESANGRTWRKDGTVTVALPQTVEVGMFVASPQGLKVTKIAGGVSASGFRTTGTATFDNVSVQAVAPQPPASWQQEAVSEAGGAKIAPPDGSVGAPPSGEITAAGGVFTLTGSGDIAGYGIASFQGGGDDDMVVLSLTGIQIGLLAIVALGVLFAAGEYRSGLIRTTFAASPRRGRVLAAKAVVLGTVVFVVGLVASFAAFLLAQPGLRRHGFEPPAYPHPSLTDPNVLRALIGTALFLAVLAVFSLGVGSILRRSARAITLVVGLVLVPQIVASFIPSFAVERWINRITPVAGLAIQHTRVRFDTAISPWAGFAVLCGWAAVAMALAVWQVRRRDA
jgi:ABC-type transport system involved in multi-copper enzyme maturation permease subunit/regulation of enolase protein 1 (concanavalin A-like superfamily)